MGGGAPEPPSLPAAPEFKNSYMYDEEGNLTGSVEEDASGNIVYKPRQLSGAELVNKKAIESTKTTLLQRLYKTPEEYTKAAQAEADAWAKSQYKTTSEQFEKDVNRIGEVSNQRGLIGSKAYADIVKGREKTLAETNTSIAGNALAMREGLLNQKRQNDYGLYSLYAGASNDYYNKSMGSLGGANSLASNINSFNQTNYANEVNARMSQYNAELENFKLTEPWRNYIIPGLQTAAMLIPGKQPSPSQQPSDRRLKKNIKPEFKAGDVQFYSFEYNSMEDFPGLQPPAGRYIGVMSDEVKHIPGAVIENALGTPYDMVDYEVIRRHLKMEMS